MRWVMGVVAASLLASSASAAEPLQEWQPAGKWEVNFADQQCLAFRPFKRGDDTVQITLEAIPTDLTGLGLYLIVPAATSSRWNNASVQVGGQLTQRREVNIFSLGDDKLRAFTSSFTNSEVARLEAGEPLSAGSKGRLLQATLAALPTVRKHLQTCVSDLLTTWGFPVEQQQKIATFPEPQGGHITRLFGPADYPSAAIRKNIDGRVRALVRVSADGQGQECRTILSSRSPELDSRTCEILMRRGRFTPGKDKTGQPMEAPFVGTINWVMPD